MLYKKTRQEAKDAGDKYYETGKACKHGHFGLRATVSGACHTCIQLAVADWTLRNKDKFVGYTKKYRDANIETVREKNKIRAAKKRKDSPDLAKQVSSKAYRKKVKSLEGREVRTLNRLHISEIEAALLTVHKGLIEYHKGYKSKHADAEFYCTEHKLIYTAAPHSVLRGANPCPKCNHMTSNGEQELSDFLAAYTTVERHNRKILAPKEIDIWLPEFNIGVEYHGLYWHTTNRVGNLHREKYDLSVASGVRLIQIFEDEWVNKKELVKERLLAFIGKSKVYNARSLQIKQLSMKEVRPFLVSKHVQGAGVSSLNYGLFDKEELVAVATFGKSRSGAMTGAKVEGEWEVARYASTGRVRGGFSKLLKQFKTDVNPTKIISYCDLRYGNGKLYEATGFVLDTITPPDYWWVPKSKIERIPRYNVQKHKIAKEGHILNKYYDKDKSEKAICEEAGWQQIYGVGSQKWVWQNPLA